MPRSFETPLGVKDYTPESLRKIESIIDGAKKIAAEYNYQGIKTPIIEYYQTVGLNSQIRPDELIRFTGPLGRMLIIRPDLTTPIARIVASTYREIDPPFRFFTYGDVYRNDAEGLIEEKTQIDFEFIGEESLQADGEIMNIAAGIIKNFSDAPIRITLGHTQVMKILLEETMTDEAVREKLIRALHTLDYVNYRKIIEEEIAISDSEKEKLYHVLTMKGNLSQMMAIEDWYSRAEWKNIFTEMTEIQKIMDQYGLGESLIFDLSLLGRHKYYTGMLFHIYLQGSPYKIASGGRYDGLIGSFGRDLNATGMAIDVVELLKMCR